MKAVLSVCNDEWRSVCMFALYTGQRLGDVATLTWAQVDLNADTVKFTTRKTDRFQELPIPAPLREHILTLPAGDDPTANIHPAAAETVNQTGKTTTLSVQFADILAAAGLREKKTHKKTADGPGRSGRKLRNPITFHSFRHTATSLMKNAGIPAAVVQDYIGHDSAEMSKLYTSIDMDAKRRAASALPSISEMITNREK
jgi:integrase